MTAYQDLVKDFAKRTKKNLHTVRKRRAKGDKVFEVTQLINSMLGLLVLPQQTYFDAIPKVKLSELREKGWPEPVLTGTIGTPKDLQDLMRLLRNSISHCNMEFTETGGKLDGVRLWNEWDEKVCDCKGCPGCGKKNCGCPKRAKKTWQVELGLDELEEIAERFIKLVLGKDSD